jgi:hypothetical protein
VPLQLDKYPSGLLEALNLKQNGVMPSAFSEQITGVVEALDFYTSDRLACAQSTAITTGAFNQTLIDVVDVGPVLLRSLGVQFIEGAAAGTFLHWALGIRGPSSTSPIAWFANNSFGAIAAGASRNFGVALPRTLVLPSGFATVGFFTSDAAGADHQFRLNRLITSLS